MESFAARLSADLEELQNRNRQNPEISVQDTGLPAMEATVFAEEAEKLPKQEKLSGPTDEIPQSQNPHAEAEKEQTEEKPVPKKVTKPVRPKVMSSRGIGGKIQKSDGESRISPAERTPKVTKKTETGKPVRKMSSDNVQPVRVRSNRPQKVHQESVNVQPREQIPERKPLQRTVNPQSVRKVSERFRSAGKLGEDSLRISSLYKSFGSKTVVRGVDFSMHTGEVVGLLGPNGAGKTTTFYMIVGFYRPTSGDVFLNEKRVTRMPMYRRAREGISYLPQEPSVFKKLTVEQNIWAILETRRDLTKAQKLSKLDQLIDEFSIGHIRKQLAYSLSGGERRRTEIARSLAIEPKFLLLDEPFAGIDPIAVADIKSIVRLLANRGIGVLITDHNVRDTLEITDRAIIISSGQIAASGNKEEILQNETARKIYLGEEFRM